jgi:ketosteroid isomerase-like protein
MRSQNAFETLRRKAMSSDENVAVLKEAYREWHDTLGESADHWLELMTDDVRFRSLTNGAETMEFTRPSCCKEDVRRYFSGLSADWKMNFYRVEEYIAQGDRVVVLSHVSFEHKRTGKTLETPKADFFRFRAGKICEFFEFFDTAGAIAAATRR